MNKLFLILFLLFPLPLHAHVVQQSSSELKVEGKNLEWTLQVHQNNFEEKFRGATSEQIKDFISRRVKIISENRDCIFDSLQAQPLAAEEKTQLLIHLHCPVDIKTLDISFGFFWGDISHQHLMSVWMLGKTFSHTFSTNDSEWTLSFSRWNLFFNFLKTGLLHIWTGLDHLLFVFTLIFAAKKFRELLLVISAFTLAHSLSLALATFDLVTLAPKIVEPLVALSIMVMACKSIFQIPSGDRSLGKGSIQFKTTLLLTFFFGLIHGLAFSEVLKETHLSGTNLIAPLFSFNLGVECGQILIIAPLFPFFIFLEKRFYALSRVIKKMSLSLIFLIAAFWLVQRVFLINKF
ncbi:MAG: HupE/UreJ family protein [Deltaproteobacteria bacterium]|nr:HupE/UreJ family protein [Deltaproteobacteria bacterium]